jgi:two-component system sensor histidine kinase HydH
MTKGVRNSTITAGLILLLALTGVVSLFWVQNYLNSRKLLQDVRALASEIVRNLPVGIVVVDSDGQIKFINSVACSLLETLPENAKGYLAKNILPESLMNLQRQIGRGNLVVEKELSMSRTKEKSIPVNVTTTNIVGEDGQYVGYMFVLKDLSELRQLELKIRQREKLAAIGNLAAGIAHEVRNPLSSIKGYVSYFGSLFPVESENRKIARITTDEVDRVNRVISELLEFARPADLRLSKTNIKELIGHALDVVSNEAASAGVKIIRKLDDDLPETVLDPDRIMQVLLNILINAIQAMEHGGEISIAARAEKKTLVVAVSDTGKGISVDEQAHMFNPYFTTKKTGTGLGMAIVHKIIENHGGTVDVRSREDIGTTVSIRLPIVS